MMLPPSGSEQEHEKGDRGRFTLAIRELPWLVVQQKVFLLQRKSNAERGSSAAEGLFVTKKVQCRKGQHGAVVDKKLSRKPTLPSVLQFALLACIRGSVLLCVLSTNPAVKLARAARPTCAPSRLLKRGKHRTLC